MHRVESDGKQYLLDCGMFQGRRKEAEKRNRDFPFNAREIEAVVGMSVESEIRFDGQRPEEAALQGEILAVSDPSGPLAKATAALARSLTKRS